MSSNLQKHSMVPFFSVVIPLYNKEKFIIPTLESVLNQSFSDFEIIIINDGSTDNSVDEVEKLKDKRIAIYNQANQGLSRARNSGIKKARADYIAFIDADDFWLPNHLEQIFNLISLYPNTGLYCTGYTIQKSKKVFHRAKFNGLPENFIGVVPGFFKHSLINCIAWISAICIPKNVFNDIGYFDIEIFSEQDTDLYIRIAFKYDVALDDTNVSAIYNRSIGNSMSHFSLKSEIPISLSKFKELELKNNALKIFMDYNRFSTLIYFKLASKKEFVKKLLNDIDLNNLNRIQRLLIWLPGSIVKLLFYIKTRLNLDALIVFKPKK